MPYEQPLYHRFVIIANPAFGSASFSWRAKCALENLGHTALWLDPERHPFLFHRAGGSEGETGKAEGITVETSLLKAFVERQKPDCLLVADGLTLTDEQIKQLEGYCEAMFVGRLIQECSDAVCGKAEASEQPFTCRAHVDESYLATPLANTVAHKPHLLCLQDATPERIEALRALENAMGDPKLPIRCIGAGWPEAWAAGGREWHFFVNLSRSSIAVVAFDDERGAADEQLLALAKADGVPVVNMGEGDFEDVRRALEGIRAVTEAGMPLEARRFAQGKFDPPSLEEELGAIVANLEDPTRTARSLTGTSQPRTIVTILGYVGKGNFGDEYILATLDERIREAIPGSTIIAVSEDPEHTFTQRGIYATTLEDIQAVDRALAYSSCALVMAGLLFDQGIRWRIGKADAFVADRYSDIPGIAAFASLAAANDTPMVFHGIGAGPLDVLDGRQLVKLMGLQGAIFTPRDKETGDLIRGCGVPSEQVIDCADTIFLHTGSTGSYEGNDAAGEKDADTDPAAEPRCRTIAVSLREYENTPDDFSQRMALAFDEALAKHEDMQMGFCLLDPSDLVVAESVMERMRLKGRCRIFDHEGDLDKLVDFLANASAGFSMRYHSALVMSANGVPCVGMDYLPKVTSLYRDLGAGGLLVPPDATVQQASSVLMDAIENADAWRTILQTRIAPLRQNSRRAFDILLEQIGKTYDAKSHRVPMEFFLDTVPAPKRNIIGLEAYGATLREHQAKLEEIIRTLDLEVASLRSENALLRDENASLKESRSFRPGERLLAALRGAFHS